MFAAINEIAAFATDSHPAIYFMFAALTVWFVGSMAAIQYGFGNCK